MAGDHRRVPAWRLRRAGAGRDRNPHQSAAAHWQEGSLAGAKAAQAAGAQRARNRARRVFRQGADPPGARAALQPPEPRRIHGRVARAHQPRNLHLAQPDHDRPRRPAAAEEPGADPQRVGGLPLCDGRAAYPPPPGRSRPAHPYSRGPDDRLPQHRGSDSRHPRVGRTQTGTDRSLRPHRHPGRRHPRDPPASAGTARRHQDRAGTGQAQGRARRPDPPARQPPGDDQAHPQGDRGRHQAIR